MKNLREPSDPPLETSEPFARTCVSTASVIRSKQERPDCPSLRRPELPRVPEGQLFVRPTVDRLIAHQSAWRLTPVGDAYPIFD
jgi:hypothetical protein